MATLASIIKDVDKDVKGMPENYECVLSKISQNLPRFPFAGMVADDNSNLKLLGNSSV